MEIDFWNKLKLAFSKPKEYTDMINADKGIAKALLCYSIVLAAISAFGFIPFFLFTAFSGLPPSGILFAFSLVGIPFNIVMTFVYALLSHVACKIFKGKGKYEDTYRAYTYSILPSTILSAIPFIGWLSVIYAYYLMSIALSKKHKISIGPAIFAAIWPMVLLLIIGVISIFLVLNALMNAF